MLEFEASKERLVDAEQTIYASNSTGGILDHARALSEFRQKRDELLAEQMRAQGLDVCAQVGDHKGEGLQGIGVIPVEEMQTVRVESRFASVGNWPESMQTVVVYMDVCSKHVASVISRANVLRAKRIDPLHASLVQSEKPFIPESVYQAFDLPTLPASQPKGISTY